jgi:hypothetical protein
MNTIKKRNPYKPYLRNIWVRRIFILTIAPTLFFIQLFINALQAAKKSIIEDISDIISIMCEAFLDNEYYD